MHNRLFVAYKPSGMSSNQYLSKIKKKYNIKKAGFSGTLDPFAKGCLIIAFGQYTKLFRFLAKTPKTYIATLWIGAQSVSLDSEKISSVQKIAPFHLDSIKYIFSNLKGTIEYTPPKFCAKKIDGKRAYELARKDKEVHLKNQTMHIIDIKMLHYRHPFLTFKVTVSEGAYVRSIGEIIAKKLGFNGSLCALERVQEGTFSFDNEKSLNPLKYLKLPVNKYIGDKENIKKGKVLQKVDFKIQNNGVYVIIQENEFSIIKIEDNQVSYELNKVALC